ncbi:GNAT family N-acetyltransferase [Streptomyces pinistramenti]|uniref:GNAT family N-acetyltransferase n=1 Tax=Streptomyces pinistramenti TaxID=2884812 RepID=UPI001D067936|nr:GNAT family N-acetyltransferase [Streptomyces pinistramenti]MCB5908600.1 GNAT family N-acetyltransferase [Streptomyces pinistramenti]
MDRPAAPLPLIRPATTADAPQIAHVHRESRRATMPYLPPQRRDHAAVTRWARETLFTTCTTWVATRGPDLIGYAAVRDDLLEHLYVRPDALRTGTGGLLLDAARTHRPDGLTLHVFARNTAARAFYARHGFTVVATGDGSSTMEGLPELTLGWTP